MNEVFGKGYEEKYYRWLGQKSKGINYAGKIEELEDASKKFAFHATEDNLWECDNNDGFMILDMYLNDFRIKSEISFFWI